MSKKIASLACAGLLSVLSATVQGSDPDFVEFVVNVAHKRGFTHCDEAVRETFSLAGGSDMRVITETFPGFEDDMLKITAAYGDVGDSIFLEAEFRRRGDVCLATSTVLLTTTDSCAEQAAQMPAFKLQAKTLDLFFTQNECGIPMILKPVGNGCVAIFQQSRVY